MEGTRAVERFLTPAHGKKLIARGLLAMPALREALFARTVVIVAGTTNAPLAEGALALIGETGFSGEAFFRGVTCPAGAKPDAAFPGDVVISRGKWLRGQTIFDAAGELREGDILLKGANAVYLPEREAGVLIGHPECGTVQAATAAAVGRRVRLILPVGLEKRVDEPILRLARAVNAEGAQGARLYPVAGEAFTELDAIALLSGGARARLIAAGGAFGYEGGCWLLIAGDDAQLRAADEAIRLAQG